MKRSHRVGTRSSGVETTTMKVAEMMTTKPAETTMMIDGRNDSDSSRNDNDSGRNNDNEASGNDNSRNDNNQDSGNDEGDQEEEGGHDKEREGTTRLSEPLRDEERMGHVAQSNTMRSTRTTQQNRATWLCSLIFSLVITST